MLGGSHDGLVESAAPIEPPGLRRAARLGRKRIRPGPGDLLVPGNGSVWKVSSEDCAVQWATGDRFFTGVVAHKVDAAFSIAVGGGELSRLRNDTGEIEWTVAHEGASGFTFAIRPQGDLVYVATSENTAQPGVTAYNTDDGSQAWNAPHVDEYNADDLDVDGEGLRVLFVAEGGSGYAGGVVALTATSGDREWTVTGSETVGGPSYVVADHVGDRVFHDTLESGVHMDCRDTADGSRLWSSTEGIVTQYDMALSRDGTQVYRSNGSGGSDLQRIIAYDASDGAVLWSYTDLADVVDRILPTRDDQLVILAADGADDRTHAIRKSDGARVWVAATGDCQHLQISPDDELAWALTRGADLSKIDRATGEILCQNTTELNANVYFPQAISRQ